MKMINALIAIVSLSAGVAMASDHGKTPNCEVKGKATHVKDEAACAKKKGKWTAAAEAAVPAEAAPAAAPAEAAPAAHK
jgi:hypothetical protein